MADQETINDALDTLCMEFDALLEFIDDAQRDMKRVSKNHMTEELRDIMRCLRDEVRSCVLNIRCKCMVYLDDHEY